MAELSAGLAPTVWIPPGSTPRSSALRQHSPPGSPLRRSRAPACRAARSRSRRCVRPQWYSAPWGPPSASLLEFAETCDVPTRWSCRTGVCHNCETALLVRDGPLRPGTFGTTGRRKHPDLLLATRRGRGARPLTATPAARQIGRRRHGDEPRRSQDGGSPWCRRADCAGAVGGRASRHVQPRDTTARGALTQLGAAFLLADKQVLTPRTAGRFRTTRSLKPLLRGHLRDASQGTS